MSEKKIELASFQLESGILLKNIEITYHTFGTRNEKSDNIIWICHALTANSNPYEWWPQICGNQGFFNDKEHFIICANILGSCYGTTGPLSCDENGERFFDEFPLITTRDMANLHDILRQKLKISKVHTLIGASLGGQQALEWAIEQPSVFQNLILIATNAKHSAYGIAFNESQRMAIEADPTYRLKQIFGGKNGLMAARSVALLSYRTYTSYKNSQTEQDSTKTTDLKAAQYQRYQGQKLANRFNAYSYVCLTKAMDAHHVGRDRESISKALGKITAKTLIIGITTDVIFPLSEQKELSCFIPNAVFRTIYSEFGHDGFLIEHNALMSIFKDFFINTHLEHTFRKVISFDELLFTA